MKFKVEDVVRDVRVALDENNSSEPLRVEGDTDTLKQDEIIESKLAEAVRTVHLAAPLHMLENGHNFGDTVVWGKKGSGKVKLPDDFLRLQSFEMSDWERPVFEARDSLSPEYLREGSRWKGIRGTTQRPRVYLVNYPEGCFLEFYASKGDGVTVRHASYIPEPRIEEGYIDISKRCYRAVIYMAASLVSGAYRDFDNMKILSDQSTLLLS